MIGKNRKTVSSVRGMTRYGVKLCQRLTKWTNEEIMGTWNLEYSGFVNDVRMKKSGIPNQGRHGFLFQEKKVIKGDDKKLSK
jgi:hypothetical protein